MFTKLFVSGIVGAAALLAATPSEAPKKARDGAMCQKLDCTDDQQSAIKQIRSAHRAEVEGVRAEVTKLRTAMAEEIAKPDFDRTKVEALHNELKSVRSQLADARLDTMLDTMEVLTPEQRAKAAKRLGKHKRKHKRHAAKRRGAKGGDNASKEGRGKRKGGRRGKPEVTASQ